MERETSLVNGAGAAFWRIGHGSAIAGAERNAPVLFLSGGLDDDAYDAPGIDDFDISDFFAMVMRENMDGGDVTIGNTGTGPMDVDHAFDAYRPYALTFLSKSDLRVSAPVDNSQPGLLNFVSGWDGTTGLTGDALFNVAHIFSNPGSFGGNLDVWAPVGSQTVAAVNLAGDTVNVDDLVGSFDLVQVHGQTSVSILNGGADAGDGTFLMRGGDLNIWGSGTDTTVAAQFVDIEAADVEIAAFDHMAGLESSGSLWLVAGGDLRLLGGTEADSVAFVSSETAMDIQVAGNMDVAGGSGDYAAAYLSSGSPIHLAVGNDLSLSGGSGYEGDVEIYGAEIHLEVGQDLSLEGGGGTGASAFIGIYGEDALVAIDMQDTETGALTLTGGTASGAFAVIGGICTDCMVDVTITGDPFVDINIVGPAVALLGNAGGGTETVTFNGSPFIEGVLVDIADLYFIDGTATFRASFGNSGEAGGTTFHLSEADLDFTGGIQTFANDARFTGDGLVTLSGGNWTGPGDVINETTLHWIDGTIDLEGDFYNQGVFQAGVEGPLTAGTFFNDGLLIIGVVPPGVSDRRRRLCAGRRGHAGNGAGRVRAPASISTTFRSPAT